MIRFSVAEIFGNGMVLQRNKPIHIFGQAEEGDRVRVSIYDYHGRLVDEINSVSDRLEKWQVTLASMEASKDNKIVVENTSSQEKIVINNVSVGEVWLAGGQSNMEFFNKYDKDWERTKNLPKNDSIHFYNVPQRAFEGHVTHNGEGRDGYGKWLNDKDAGYENFSAPAYSFARRIQEKLQVPVGIIGCNWGGTTAIAWVPEQVLHTKELKYYLDEYDEAVKAYSKKEMKTISLLAWEKIDTPSDYKNFEPLLYGLDREAQLDYMEKNADGPVVPLGPYNENRPAGLYETMLQKVIPYTIAGALWYQGESDSGDRAKTYDLLLSGLIKAWRKDWDDDFPFILVQLAPFGEWLACTNDDYSLVRQKQQQVADTMDDVYMTSIMDIGSYYDIHPKEKVEVGRRLALLALSHVYHKLPVEETENPRFKSGKVDGKSLILEFTNSKNLSVADKSDIQVTVDGKAILPTEVTAENNTVTLTIDQEIPADAKVTVSFGWADYAVINIKNEQGLPIAPFQATLCS